MVDENTRPWARPTPGSEEARAKGCRCPVLDNEHGRGYLGLGVKGIYVVVQGCPLHDPNRLVGEAPVVEERPQEAQEEPHAAAGLEQASD